MNFEARRRKPRPVNQEKFRREEMQTDTSVSSKTRMTHEQMKELVRNHFEEFVNRKNPDIADVNFAPEFVDHGTDVPSGMPPGPAGAKA